MLRLAKIFFLVFFVASSTSAETAKAYFERLAKLGGDPCKSLRDQYCAEKSAKDLQICQDQHVKKMSDECWVKSYSCHPETIQICGTQEKGTPFYDCLFKSKGKMSKYCASVFFPCFSYENTLCPGLEKGKLKECLKSKVSQVSSLCAEQIKKWSSQ